MGKSLNKKNELSIQYRKTLNPSKTRELWLTRLVLCLCILITLFPIFSIVAASLTAGDTFFSTTLLPSKWSFSNYTTVIFKTDFLIWVKNSMILCTSVSVIQLGVTITGSYAFARMKFKGRKNGLMGLLILQMFPSSMALPAILGIAYKLNWIDQFWALILLMCGGSAFSIWLLKGFIDSLPKELDEAAMVDGASYWQTFYKIILPLAKPMLAVIFLFSFIGIYSEYLLTTALMKDAGNQTIATGLRTFINNQFSAHWTQYSAAAVMASIPVVIIFMLLQKFIAAGLTAGAVKG